MTQVNMNDIVYCSLFPGLGNYKGDTLAFTIPAQSLDGNAFPLQYYESFHTMPLDNDNAISQIQINIQGTNIGYENYWYNVRGSKALLLKASNERTTDLLSSKYELTIEAYYESSNLNIHTTILTTALEVVNIPAITITVDAQLFLAPF